MPQRYILHVDMDAFFASVEQRDNPVLRGRPVVVGGSPEERGVVAAASYEARGYGIKSAMSMAAALRLCTDLIRVPPNHKKYREVSDHLMSIFSDYTPLVEPVSLDEAYLDVTGCTRLFGPPEDIARQIQKRIADELCLTASVGVGPNKFIAKLASDFRKPRGITVILPTQVDSFLANMPVEKVWGIGPRTCAELKKIGVTTVGKLRDVSFEYLSQRFGKYGRVLYGLARGMDDRPVVSERQVKSMGKEITFPRDVRDVAAVEKTLIELVEKVGRRLRKNRLACASVTLKLRYADLRLVTRMTGLPEYTNLSGPISKAAVNLLKMNWNGYPSLRLVGISVGKLAPDTNIEPSLFPEESMEKEKKITLITDKLKEKFGEDVVKSASLLQFKKDIEKI